jgi:hypothetical protein
MRQQLDSGLGNVTKKDIKTAEDGIAQLEKMLSRKISLTNASQKLRAKRKTEMNELLEQNPDMAKKLKIRDTVGRPRVEDDQTDLLETIKSLAMFGGAADEKRRSEAIRSCRTLDDLHTELNAAGFIISRSATYLRLLPKRSNSIEGKHHVVTVPVKLKRPESNLHAKHPDGRFCTASIYALPLFVNLQLNNHVQKDEMGAFVIPPYELHCPSVQLQLVKRCCSVCGIYHASVKSAVNHVKVHRRTSFGVIPQEIIEKKRPVRVAARRQREMMVVLRDHLNNESAEWLDVEEIDMDLQEPEQQTPAVMPVIENIQQWATNSVWEDL